MRKRNLLGLLLALGLAAGSVASAEPNESTEAAEVSATEAPAVRDALPLGNGIAIVGACLGAGLCAIGGGFAIARIGGNCIEAIARQPEAAGAMFAPMIVSAAMVEGGMLFAIVVCLLGVLGI